jgi:hypothetical protein
MNLEDFEDEIDPIILDRGEEYFECKAVESLTKISPSQWQADVAGTDDYRVEVTIEDGEIIDWDCTCPYDWGPVCKHVVAVLYEIKQAVEENRTEIHQKIAATSKTKEKSQFEQFGEILQKVSKEELTVFLKKFALNDDHFLNEFLIHFAELAGSKQKKDYKTWIKELAESYSGRYGFIEYESSFPLFRQIDSLLKKAGNFFDKNNIAEAIDICQAVIEEVPIIVQNMDDSAGFSSSAVDWAFSLILENLDKMQPSEKEMLLSYCLKEFYKRKYTDFGWENKFLELMPYLVANSNQEKKFFAVLEETEKKIGKDNSWSWTFHIVQLRMAKLEYFLIAGKKEEAKKFALENIEFDEFRKFLIDEAIEERDFDRAKELISGGIEAAQRENFRGTVVDYKLKLLEIAQILKNKADIRKYAEEMFLLEHFDFQYYEILKSTYTKTQWKEVVEKIIDKIKRADIFGGVDSILAEVYVREQYLDQLLKLLEKNSDNLHFVEMFAKHIKKNYPEELLNIYAQAVTVYAVNTGRNYYNEIARAMKKMQKIPGGKKVVRKLVADFKEKYPRRRAMMEILNRNFK